MLDDAIVAADDASQTAFGHIVAGRSALGEGARADETRISGVKSLDPLQRKTALVREPRTAGARVEKLPEAAVAACSDPSTLLRVTPSLSRGERAAASRRAAAGQQPHDAIEPFPEVVHRPKPRARKAESLTRDVEAREPCLAQEFYEGLRAAMDEFGPKLDRNRRFGIVMGEDAAADPLARFEHHDVDIFLVQRARGGNA
jgi:hypothetical protein